MLIDHIDSVTGGASAAYGSGAISGVQNIFLNRRLDGVRLDVDTYQTAEGDGQDDHVGFAFGTAFSDDRGHFVVGAEHEKSEADQVPGPGLVPAGQRLHHGRREMPSNVLASDVRANQISYTGVFNNFMPGATTAQQANAAGTASCRSTSVRASDSHRRTATSTFNNVVGGDGISIYQYTNLTAPVDRNVFTGLFTFAFNDKIEHEHRSVVGQGGDGQHQRRAQRPVQHDPRRQCLRAAESGSASGRRSVRRGY